jgi:hypothetical protein
VVFGTKMLAFCTIFVQNARNAKWHLVHLVQNARNAKMAFGTFGWHLVQWHLGQFLYQIPQST